MTNLVATERIIRARLQRAIDKGYKHGVIGIRLPPVWDSDDFEIGGVPVTVVACPSVLAIWEAIDSRRTNEWTVVLTDIDDGELGDNVLAHLINGGLRTADPWDALRSNFSATTIESALSRLTDNRAVANGLLTVLTSYPTAPGGVLTRDHAMTAVARDALGIVKETDTEVDAFAVLEWSRSAEAARR